MSDVWGAAKDVWGAAKDVVGGAADSAGSVGKNTYHSADFKDTNGYNPNAQYLGGRQGYAEEQANQLGGLAGAADQRQAIQANYGNANADRSLGLGVRGSQADALGMMRSGALGQQPSVAQMQMQQGQSRALSDQMSMLASQPSGPGAALAARGAMANQANMSASTAANSSMLRAQEMEQARNAYMQGSLGMGQQDLSRQGLDANMAQANAQYALGSQGQNDARSLALRNMQQAMMQNEAQRAMANNGLLAQTHGAADSINAGVNQFNAGQEMQRMAAYSGMISGAAQAGMGMAGSSGGAAGPGPTGYSGGIPGAGGAGSLPAGSGGGY